VADLLRIKYEKSRNHYKTIAQFVPLIVELVYKKAKRNYSRRMTEPSQTAPPQTDRISEGIGYYQRGLWRMAQLSFESSIRNRDGAQAWLNLAITLRSLGQMNESATAHSIAIELSRCEQIVDIYFLADALSSRADMKESLGDQLGAYLDLSEALNVAPMYWPKRTDVSKHLLTLKPKIAELITTY
jgi:tetratricopeptide (TPR) repeat protein